MPAVFISHSTVEAALAEGVERLLRAAFRVPVDGIRCAVTPTGAHPAGSDTSKQLLADIAACEAFVLVATPESVRSQWVLMEAGAAWALGKPILPLLAVGALREDLPEPIRTLNPAKLAEDQGGEELVAFVSQHAGWKGPRDAKAWGEARVAVRSASVREAQPVESGGSLVFAVDVKNYVGKKLVSQTFHFFMGIESFVVGMVRSGCVGKFTLNDVRDCLIVDLAERLDVETDRIEVLVEPSDFVGMVAASYLERLTKQSYQISVNMILNVINAERQKTASSSKSIFPGARLRRDDE